METRIDAAMAAGGRPARNDTATGTAAGTAAADGAADAAVGLHADGNAACHAMGAEFGGREPAAKTVAAVGGAGGCRTVAVGGKAVGK